VRLRACRRRDRYRRPFRPALPTAVGLPLVVGSLSLGMTAWRLGDGF